MSSDLRMIKFCVLFLLTALSKSAVSSCIGDDRTLTEMLFRGTNKSIFSCVIVESGTTVEGRFYSSAKLREVYFGKIDTSIVTLHTGSANGSSYNGYRMKVGETYLIYTGGDGKTFSCCGSCDERSKQIDAKLDSTYEIKLLRQFSGILKKKKSGNYIFKNANGIVIAKGKFKRGKAVGNWKHYNANGIIKAEYDLDKNITTEFSEKGFIKTKATTIGKSGIYENYSKTVNGLLEYKGIETQNDSGNILQMFEYFENGNLKKVSSQVNINLQGGGMGSTGKTAEYKEFYENGKIHVEGEYLNGKRIKIWRYYNEDGTLKTEFDYKDGTGSQ